MTKLKTYFGKLERAIDGKLVGLHILEGNRVEIFIKDYLTLPEIKKVNKAFGLHADPDQGIGLRAPPEEHKGHLKYEVVMP